MEPASKIRAKELFNLVQKRAKLAREFVLREVILATKATLEGEILFNILRRFFNRCFKI